MTQLIEISKTMSSPAISGIPSFLTTLPAEVRNCVYEVLFERKKHVLLHNADAYNPRHSDQADYEDNDQFREALRTYDEDLDRNMLRDEDFKHGFGGELALLLNCRQVYYECAGVLYGGNTFVISRALHRHDGPNEEGKLPLHVEDYSQFAFAPIWLSKIGSHIKLMQKVFIDIDANCSPEDCPSAWERFDVLPLLRLIWSNSGLENKIRFLEHGKHLDRDLHHGSDDPEDGDSDSDSNSDDNTSSDDNDDNQHSDTNDADVDVEEGDARLHERTKLLDNFLVNLSTYDVLNLKPYRHFGWVLKEVFVPLLSPGEVAQVDADVDVLFDCSGEEYFREYTVP